MKTGASWGRLRLSGCRKFGGQALGIRPSVAGVVGPTQPRTGVVNRLPGIGIRPHPACPRNLACLTSHHIAQLGDYNEGDFALRSVLSFSFRAVAGIV